ncbi:Peptidyl-prolyl cis-trans isomerase-like 3 [Myotis davidii]|nr:Peptidyl-prolyl cis-trans isomerase-like 3 [Myotis davidii]
MLTRPENAPRASLPAPVGISRRGNWLGQAPGGSGPSHSTAECQALPEAVQSSSAWDSCPSVRREFLALSAVVQVGVPDTGSLVLSRNEFGIFRPGAGVTCHRIFSVLAAAVLPEVSVTLHTDVGDIKIEIFCERTPKACENFLALCASNYYNGCIFHRNIKGFMVQTGDPSGTGRGGNSIWGKKFEDEYSEYLKHNVRGVVSMANNGPNTNGSQFFITYGKQPHLDMKYTVFGKVIDGLETLDELEKLPVNEKTYRPLNDVHIKDITIHANPFAQ